MDSNQKAIDQLIRGMQYLIDQAKKEDTKIYDGVVISASSGGKWNIKYNNKTHAVSSYGNSTPTANSVVKVIVPQGNQNLAWFFIPGSSGGAGGDGATFIPSVSEAGVISWTNDKGLPNPSPVNIKGPQGIQGIQGIPGQQGIPGNDATINGQNTINIIAGENIDLQQSGGNLIVSSTSSASGLFSTSFSGTLLSSGWVGSGTSYTQSISVSGLTTNSTPVVIPQWGGNKDQEELEWSNLSSTVESISGQLLFTSTQPTTVNINFIVYF